MKNSSCKISHNILMESGNRKLLALTIWTVLGSYAALLLMCIATFTNHWIYTRETIKMTNENGTIGIREIREHSGLLVACELQDKIHWEPSHGANYTEDRLPRDNRCQKLSEYNTSTTITHAVYGHTNKSFIPPLLTCFMLLSAVIVCTVAQFMPKRRCLVFVNGTICIISGLTSLTTIVRYIIAVNDAIIEKQHSLSNDVTFKHEYNISFILAVFAFLQTNSVGVASLYLFIRLEKQAAQSEKDRVRHHLHRLGMSVIRNQTDANPSYGAQEVEGEGYGIPSTTWKETQYGFEGDPNWKEKREKEDS